MDALKLLAAGAALIVASPARAHDVGRWRPLIAEASTRFGLPVDWIARVMQAESRGMTMWRGRPITSRAGAMGLMQLMPATWAEMRIRLGLGTDPYDPHDNILAGSLFLRLMYDRFGYPGLFGAYSAGPGRYTGFATAGRTLPVETRTYMTVMAGTVAKPAAAPIAVPDRLFFAFGTGPLAPVVSSSLFATIAGADPDRISAAR